MEVDLLSKGIGITGLGFQEGLCGIRVGDGLEVRRDWRQLGRGSSSKSLG